MVNVGDRIRAKRIELGMTQEELAIKMGYQTRGAVTQIESSSDLSIKKIRRASEALGCSIDELIGLESSSAYNQGLADAELIKSMASVKLSKKEKKLVEIYQLLSNKNQNTLEMVSEALLIAQLSPAIEEYQALLNKSNDESE